MELLAAGVLEKLTESWLKMAEHRRVMCDLLQQLHRFALLHHKKIKKARNRGAGEAWVSSFRKQVSACWVPFCLPAFFVGQPMGPWINI